MPDTMPDAMPDAMPDPVQPTSPLAALRRSARTVRRLLHAIVGAPDYDRYLAHARACHPDRAPMTRDEFARERLAARYDRPGARCC